MKFLSVCSGIEAASVAWKPLGWTPLAFSEINDFCRALLAHHYPGVPLYGDFTTLLEADWLGEVDLLVGGTPCFAAGTLVLTEEGYWPIEELRVGQKVLTHRGRWRAITSVMRRDNAELLTIHAQGVPGVVTTEEHPFFARHRTMKWSPEVKQNVRVFGDPAWVEAGKLSNDYYLGQVLPEVRDDDRSEAFWFMIGRYLADGWIVDSKRTSTVEPGHRGSRINSYKHAIVICANDTKSPALEAAIREAGFTPSMSRERTVNKFTFYSAELVEFLRAFGRYAHGKRIPNFALALPQNKAKALLDGYMAGDGHQFALGCTVNTVSKALALGMALVAQRAYGVVATVRRNKMPPTTVIEGRTVNQRDFFSLTIPTSNRSGFVEADYGWKLVRKVEKSGVGTVFNISVEEDESYIADGAVVHNCQAFSHAGLRASLEDERGNLTLEFIRLANAIDAVRGRLGKPPVWIVWENVPGVLDTHDNAFGHFVGGLCGSGAALDVPARGWPDAGVAAGPERCAAWRALDAQHFGLAQRRKRIFVFARRHPRAWTAPDALLPIVDRLRWHSAPSRQAGENVAGTLAGRTSAGGGLGTDTELDGGLVLDESFGGGRQLAPALTHHSGRRDPTSELFIIESDSRPQGPVSLQDSTLGSAGQEGGGIGRDDLAYTLLGTGRQGVIDPGGEPLPSTISANGLASANDAALTLNRRCDQAAVFPSAVRRITPREAERLMGFPEEYTAVPYRGKPASECPDTPRYRALGNSIAIPVLRYLGEQIVRVEGNLP